MARMNVRMDEVEESINIIEYAIDNLHPDNSELLHKVCTCRRSVNRVEAPRGELFYYVRSNGTDMQTALKSAHQHSLTFRHSSRQQLAKA